MFIESQNAHATLPTESRIADCDGPIWLSSVRSVRTMGAHECSDANLPQYEDFLPGAGGAPV